MQGSARAIASTRARGRPSWRDGKANIYQWIDEDRRFCCGVKYTVKECPDRHGVGRAREREAAEDQSQLAVRSDIVFLLKAFEIVFHQDQPFMLKVLK